MHDFTNRHVLTLALLKAIEEPAGSDFLTALIPLSPSELQEFLRKGLDTGLVVIHSDGAIGLVKDLPVDVSRRLSRINTKERLGELVDAMRRLACRTPWARTHGCRS